MSLLRPVQQNYGTFPTNTDPKFYNEIHRILSFSDNLPIGLYGPLAKYGYYADSFTTSRCAFCTGRVWTTDASGEHVCQNNTRNIKLPDNRRNYRFEANRIISFIEIGWPKKANSSWPMGCLELARWGFYFDLETRCPRCTFCYLVMRDWKREDIVETKHRLWNSHCLLLVGRALTNVALGQENNDNYVVAYTCFPNGSYGGVPEINQQLEIKMAPEPKFKDFCTFGSRLTSFSRLQFTARTQPPRNLSRAGFFYSGFGDRMTCYQCGLNLDNWESLDDAWVEHAFFNPLCLHVNLHKGLDFVEKVLALKSNPMVAHSAYPAVQDRAAVDAEPRSSREEQQPTEENSRQEKLQQSGQTSNATNSAVQQLLNAPTVANNAAAVAVDENDKCLKCKIHKRDVAYLPCGHLITCFNCLYEYEICPVCKVKVASIIFGVQD